MKLGRYVAAAVAVLLICGSLVPLARADREADKVRESADVLQAIMTIPEKGIPPALLKNASAVALVPGVIKAAFVIGGKHGTGVLMVRQGGTWSNPIFISLTGGSIGWQIGAQSTDVILVFKNSRSVDAILKGKVTLGADASVAAGPVGRSAEAATDVMLKSEIYSYSRSRGLFAGVSLGGAALLVDDDADAAYYGSKDIRARDILSGKAGKATPAAEQLKQELIKYSNQ